MLEKTQLAERIGKTPSYIGRLMEDLINKDLATENAERSYGNCKIYCITDTGRDYLKNVSK